MARLSNDGVSTKGFCVHSSRIIHVKKQPSYVVIRRLIRGELNSKLVRCWRLERVIMFYIGVDSEGIFENSTNESGLLIISTLKLKRMVLHCGGVKYRLIIQAYSHSVHYEAASKGGKYWANVYVKCYTDATNSTK